MEIQKAISASLLRLRMKSPFFATLAMFAQFVPSQEVDSAATDGKDIYFNPDFLLSLSPNQQDAILLHEVLHAALLHVTRRGVRDRELWNIAADIVINGIIAQQGIFELPAETLRDPDLENLSVEEIYEILAKDRGSSPDLSKPDLLDRPPQDSSGKRDNEGEESNSDSMSQARKGAIEANWQNALQQAATVIRAIEQGDVPAGVKRELGSLSTAQIDWRTYLWRYMVKTPTDFSGFDRRFIGRGLYLENLQGESVNVYVCIDTSGSVDSDILKVFLAELKGILNSYPHLKCELYYADVDVYGPYQLEAHAAIPKPEGGGGTSFIPFFEKVATSWDGQNQAVCVYLTDGYGTFPEWKPELPVLWVVTPGGAETEDFPFGEAVRLGIDVRA
ncbi:MAG: VWA-like domain-containing protein [Mastigocoleus sp. MO_167.B18]|nr:VWA-like domain-containing protein [Mastigocoleus sp. MO_167.B18]